MYFEDKNVISGKEIKDFMTLLVEQAKKHPTIYKYLTYESGCQMLQYNNIQFTRGDILNDKEDLNISKFNIEDSRKLCENIGIEMDIIDKKYKEQSDILSSFGVCSLGVSPTNSILWERYSRSESGLKDGICIGLNQNKVINALLKQGIKTACILVRYKQTVSNSIPWFALNGKSPVKIFVGYQFFALKKSNPWEAEQEIRLVYPTTLEDEYKRFVLPKDCFTYVYYGKDMTVSQKQIVGQILYRNLPNVEPRCHNI